MTEKDNQMGCPHCDTAGSLNIPGSGKCVACNGNGYQASPDIPCGICGGSGLCRICGGSGWISNLSNKKMEG